jgi:hypothetical protein
MLTFGSVLPSDSGAKVLQVSWVNNNSGIAIRFLSFSNVLGSTYNKVTVIRREFRLFGLSLAQ